MADQPSTSFALSDETQDFIRSRVETVVGREVDRGFRKFKWIVAIVGVVGLGTFGSLANYLIEKAVNVGIEEKLGEMEDAMEAVRFVSRVQALDLKDSFSVEDVAAIMSYLRRSASNERVRNNPEFTSALTMITKSFVEADQGVSLDEIMRIYERDVLASGQMIELLLHHYGRVIIGRAQVPQDDFALATFEKLEAAGEGNNLSEISLFYRCLYTHRQKASDRDKMIRDYLMRIAQDEAADRERFFYNLFRVTTVSNWQLQQPSDIARAMEPLTRDFLADNSRLLSEIFQVQDETIFKEMGSSGLSDEEASFLASAIAWRDESVLSLDARNHSVGSGGN